METRKKIDAPVILIPDHLISVFKKKEIDGGQLPRWHKLGLVLTLVLVGSSSAFSVAAAEQKKGKDAALNTMNPSDLSAKVASPRPLADVSPYELSLDGEPAGIYSSYSDFDSSPFLKQRRVLDSSAIATDTNPALDHDDQEPTPTNPAGLRPAHYDHTELSPLFNQMLENSARERGGDPLVFLTIAADSNGVLRVQNNEQLSQMDFKQLIEGEGPINEALNRLVNTLEFQGVTEGYRIEFLGQNWTNPDQTTLSVFATLTQDTQLNFRDEAFRAGSRFFVREDGIVFPIEVGEEQDVRVMTYTHDLYQHLLAGFPNIPSPLPHEMVALVTQGLPQGRQVMRVFFGDGSFHDLAGTTGSTPEPSPVPTPPETADEEEDGYPDSKAGEDTVELGLTPEALELMTPELFEAKAYVDQMLGPDFFERYGTELVGHSEDATLNEKSANDLGIEPLREIIWDRTLGLYKDLKTGEVFVPRLGIRRNLRVGYLDEFSESNFKFGWSRLGIESHTDELSMLFGVSTAHNNVESVRTQTGSPEVDSAIAEEFLRLFPQLRGYTVIFVEIGEHPAENQGGSTIFYTTPNIDGGLYFINDNTMVIATSTKQPDGYQTNFITPVYQMLGSAFAQLRVHFVGEPPQLSDFQNEYRPLQRAIVDLIMSRSGIQYDQNNHLNTLPFVTTYKN